MKDQKLKLVVVFFTFFIFNGCNNYKIVTCSDGRPVKIPKSEKIYRQFYQNATKELDINLKTSLEIIDKAITGIENAQVKIDAILLKDKLNQDAIKLTENIKASLIALRSDPCTNKDKHAKLLEAINDKNKWFQELKAEFVNHTSEIEIAKTLDVYSKGKGDEGNLTTLTSEIEKYFSQNQKYPNNLADLNINDIIAKLGISRLEYIVEAIDNYTLRFAGDDYILKTSDDKVFKAQMDTTAVTNQN